MYSDSLLIFFRAFSWALYIVLSFWWLYLPIVLLIILARIWEVHNQEKYYDAMKWVVLKIKPPPTIDRSLKGMEQFFVNLHGTAGKTPNKRDRILRGKQRDYFVFEIVGNQGMMEFYVRTPEASRNLIESNIFSQYPDAEVTQVEDWLAILPKFLPNEQMDLSGGEQILEKDSAYPLLTYEHFQEKPARKDDLTLIDPLASLAETFSTFRPGEWFVLQFLLMPEGDSWVKKSRVAVDKVLGKETKPKLTLIDQLFDLLWKLIGPTIEEKKEEKKEKKLNYGEEESVKAMEKKLAHLGYRTGLRLMYIARKEVFHKYHMAAVTGALKQFNSGMLNSFKSDKTAGTSSDGMWQAIFPSGKGFFAESQTFAKKAGLYFRLRRRDWTNHHFILTTDELATLYHLPGPEIKAPLFPRVEAKMGQPPSNLELE